MPQHLSPRDLPPVGTRAILGIGAAAAVLAAIVIVAGAGSTAKATIAFRNDTGKACSYCHATPGTDMKILSVEGQRFRNNGYKLDSSAAEPSRRPSDEDRPSRRPSDSAHRKPSWCNTQDSLNRAERTICDSALLSDLDFRLNAAYRGSDVSTDSQRRWIARRNDCGSSESCLVRVYEERIRELRD